MSTTDTSSSSAEAADKELARAFQHDGQTRERREKIHAAADGRIEGLTAQKHRLEKELAPRKIPTADERREKELAYRECCYSLLMLEQCRKRH